MPHHDIFWFRRDLRLDDNAGLYHALKSGNPIQCIFIFDRNILDKLPKDDARVSFIHTVLSDLKIELQNYGCDLKVYYGYPLDVWQQIIANDPPKTIFTNRDYESYAIDRDNQVQKMLAQKGIQMQTFKDQVIFEMDEVVKDDGKPYTVFTPYKNKWLAKLDSMKSGSEHFYFKSYPSRSYLRNLRKTEPQPLISLGEMGFTKSNLEIPSKVVPQKIIAHYDETRNFPSILGTSRLGIHFRFGTISIREKARKAIGLNTTYLNELTWRDFYSMILSNFPHVARSAFRPEYEKIEWSTNMDHFEAWKEGKTGYPIVDAGMRELNTTGYMHNRVRMIVASFLSKHLLIDWRLGEAYFAEKLLDFDLASNNGGWQWAAGCGTDAAPYFRIFNPTSQQEKFDKDFKYIKAWVPEFGKPSYSKPIVDHKEAREKCLATYAKALKG
jgi:deoxyribodipyrimidine photo-lyase